MKKKLRLRKWVRVTLFIIICGLFTILFLNSMKKETAYNTPKGSYTCNGTILKVCSGSSEAYDYVK